MRVRRCFLVSEASLTRNQDDAFKEFLQLCEPGLESSAVRYERLRVKLIKFFEWKRCNDLEGLADETIARVVEGVHRGDEVEKPLSYIYGVARNVFRESIRRQSRLAFEILDARSNWEAPLTRGQAPDEFLDCARICLDALSEDKKRLLEAYYSCETEREALAQSLGLSLVALRTKLHRIRAELRSCYQACMEKEMRSRH